jgi:hypothetical protein
MLHLVAGVLFFLLSPGVLLTIPAGSKGLFASGQTSVLAAAVHAVVFVAAIYLLSVSVEGFYEISHSFNPGSLCGTLIINNDTGAQKSVDGTIASDKVSCIANNIPSGWSTTSAIYYQKKYDAAVAKEKAEREAKAAAAKAAAEAAMKATNKGYYQVNCAWQSMSLFPSPRPACDQLAKCGQAGADC